MSISRDSVLYTWRYLVITIVAVTAAVECFPSIETVVESKEFQQFCQEYGKQHVDASEMLERYAIWDENRRLIARHNAEAARGLHSYTMGMNQFGDMTHEEYMKTMLKVIPDKSRSSQQKSACALSSLPTEVDWKAKGYVTEVGNQGQCGSCWAFTATGALEGQHKKKTGTLVKLSEQNLMDCSSKQGNQGCEGGLMDSSFKYVKENGGIDTEKGYPYNQLQPGSKTCRYSVKDRGATCTGYVDLPKGNETALQEAVACVGPIATAVDASHSGFQLYKSGVYDDKQCSSRIVDHSLVVTGYGVEDGKEYYECKNSWGTTWGNQGYIRMARNKKNQCGIASTASYPTV